MHITSTGNKLWAIADTCLSSPGISPNLYKQGTLLNGIQLLILPLEKSVLQTLILQQVAGRKSNTI